MLLNVELLCLTLELEWFNVEVGRDIFLSHYLSDHVFSIRVIFITWYFIIKWLFLVLINILSIFLFILVYVNALSELVLTLELEVSTILVMIYNFSLVFYYKFSGIDLLSIRFWRSDFQAFVFLAVADSFNEFSWAANTLNFFLHEPFASSILPLINVSRWAVCRVEQCAHL